MDFYVKLMMGKGPEGVKEYLDKYVFGPETWDDYLEKCGFKNILQASIAGRRIYND
jgi:glutaconate CoA-transferase subunit A